jgi:tRNA(fMet)-specific endonuclease VapC
MAPSELALSEVVFAEMLYGARSLGNTKRARSIFAFIEEVRSEFQVVPWTPSVSDAFASIKQKLRAQGLLIEDFDVAIAAHALAANATLVTANTKHFARIVSLRTDEWT